MRKRPWPKRRREPVIEHGVIVTVEPDLGGGSMLLGLLARLGRRDRRQALVAEQPRQ
jgi:hypothetical protein